MFATSNNYPQQQQQLSHPSRMDSRSPARACSYQSSYGEHSPTLQHIQIQKFPSSNSGSPGSHSSNGRRSSVQHTSSSSSVDSNSNRSVGSHSTGGANKTPIKKKDFKNININNSSDKNDINGNYGNCNINNIGINVSTDETRIGQSPRRQSMIPIAYVHHDVSSSTYTQTPAHHSPSQLLSKAHQSLSQNSLPFRDGGRDGGRDDEEKRSSRSSLSTLGFGTVNETWAGSGSGSAQRDTVRDIEGQENDKREAQAQGRGQEQEQGGKHTPRRGSIIPQSIHHHSSSSSSSSTGTDKVLDRGAGTDREARIKTGSGTGRGLAIGLERQEDLLDHNNNVDSNKRPTPSLGSPPRRQSLIPQYDTSGESSYSYYQSQSQNPSQSLCRSPTSTLALTSTTALTSIQNQNLNHNQIVNSDNIVQAQSNENSSNILHQNFIPNFDNQFNKEEKYKNKDKDRDENKNTRSTIKPFQNISIMTDPAPWDWEKTERRDEGK